MPKDDSPLRMEEDFESAWKGKVYFVGAGPGDPELLTLKAVRVLREADVVLHDELVAREILSLVPPSAQVCNVGKRCGRKTISQDEINALLVAYAAEGLTVVRLKGGDPLVFGRTGEEMETLREAGIDFKVVPGVTAALGAAASARIPLTDRRLASQLVFLTGHRAGKALSDRRSGVSPGATLVVYMPGDNHGGLVAELNAAGWSGQTPCLIVSRAGMPGEQMYRATLDTLLKAPRLPAPALLIVGAVTAAGRFAWDAAHGSNGRLAARINEPRSNRMVSLPMNQMDG